jgi:hypothetical protein
MLPRNLVPYELNSIHKTLKKKKTLHTGSAWIPVTLKTNRTEGCELDSSHPGYKTAGRSYGKYMNFRACKLNRLHSTSRINMQETNYTNVLTTADYMSSNSSHLFLLRSHFHEARHEHICVGCTWSTHSLTAKYGYITISIKYTFNTNIRFNLNH